MTDIPPPPGDLPPPPPPSGYPTMPPPPGSPQAPPPGYSSTYGTTDPVSLRYAGVGKRFGAILIDGLITALFGIPAIIAVATGPTKVEACTVDDAGDIVLEGQHNAFCEVPTGGTWAMFALLLFLAFVAALVYYTVPVGRSGQTVGKRATGVRVVDATTGLPIGTGRAVGRFLFAWFISGNFCLLGYLWALWDKRKQTWHDKVVSSVVVEA